jgi:ubiquinone/menaquinone biosynthesis C-methylase UbiE
MAADVAGPASRVLGVDLSLAMLRGARAKLGARPIRLAAMDGHTLACRDHAFDAVICQLGLMFFPNPLAALREARRVLRPRGRFAALVWSRAERVPWFGTLAQELVAHLPARRAEVFQSVSLGDAYWAQMEAGAIRIGLMLRDLPDDTRRAIREAVATRLAPFQSRGRLTLPTEAFLVSGSK